MRDSQRVDAKNYIDFPKEPVNDAKLNRVAKNNIFELAILVKKNSVQGSYFSSILAQRRDKKGHFFEGRKDREREKESK